MGGRYLGALGAQPCGVVWKHFSFSPGWREGGELIRGNAVIRDHHRAVLLHLPSHLAEVRPKLSNRGGDAHGCVKHYCLTLERQLRSHHAVRCGGGDIIERGARWTRAEVRSANFTTRNALQRARDLRRRSGEGVDNYECRSANDELKKGTEGIH